MQIYFTRYSFDRLLYNEAADVSSNSFVLSFALALETDCFDVSRMVVISPVLKPI